MLIWKSQILKRNPVSLDCNELYLYLHVHISLLGQIHWTSHCMLNRFWFTHWREAGRTQGCSRHLGVFSNFTASFLQTWEKVLGSSACFAYDSKKQKMRGLKIPTLEDSSHLPGNLGFWTIKRTAVQNCLQAQPHISSWKPHLFKRWLDEGKAPKQLLTGNSPAFPTHLPSVVPYGSWVLAPSIPTPHASGI